MGKIKVGVLVFLLFVQLGFMAIPAGVTDVDYDLTAVDVFSAAGTGNDAGTVSADPAIVEEVRDIIVSDYPMEIPPGVLEATTIPDMLDALGDPYAHYLRTAEFTDLMNVINMSFVGIGVVLNDHSEGIAISQVFQGGPAAEAGLRPGDILISADGVDLQGKSCMESAVLLRGEVGTQIELCFSRDGETLTVFLERRAVQIPQVTGEAYDTVGVIAISSFGMGMEKEFAETVKVLRQQGVQSFIIDLRGNGGGLVETALEMLGFFIGDQLAVVWETSKTRSSEVAVPQDLVIEEPVIVLADGISASASEIVIGALQDYKKATVLGRRTYGSGRFKQVFPLSNGDYFMMTITRFFTPGEKPVDFVGLFPDLQLSDETAMTAAMMLLREDFSTPGESDDAIAHDESGYLKWQVGSRSFRISLDEWRKEENWSAGQEMISQCLGSTSVSIGTAQGWQKISDEDLFRRWPVYYPGYRFLNQTALSGAQIAASPQDMVNLQETAGSRDIANPEAVTPQDMADPFDMAILQETTSLQDSQPVIIQGAVPYELLPYMNQAEFIDVTNGHRVEAVCRFREQGIEVIPLSYLSPSRYWLVITNGDKIGVVGEVDVEDPHSES
ncbi:MAG: S41 family peptidase [Peptococcaceae bacterium]|nr:S41 family peptidase [Peptococcaceae bacterium]